MSTLPTANDKYRVIEGTPRQFVDRIGWGEFQWIQNGLQHYHTGLWGFNSLVTIFIVPQISCNEFRSFITTAPPNAPLAPFQAQSMSMAFDLTCDRNWMRQLLSILFFVGFWIGLGIGGSVSDAKGRRPATILGVACLTVATTLSIFAPTFTTFLILRVLVGISHGMLSVACWVSAVEGCPARYTGIIAATFSAAFSGFGVLQAFIVAPLLPNWRHHLAFIAVATAPLFYLAANMKESPIWLAAKGNSIAATAILLEMAKTNRVDLYQGADDIELVHNSGESTPTPDDAPTQGTTTTAVFCSNATLRKVTAAHGYLWWSMSVLYYGLGLNVGALGGNLYITAGLSSMMDLPGQLLVVLTLDRYGRKNTHLIAYLFAGICCLAFTILPYTWVQARMWTALLGKIGAAFPAAAMYAWTGEVMPTVIRSTGTAICSQVSRVGGMMAPVMIAAITSDAVLYGVWGSSGIVAGWVCWTQFETLGRTPPETVAGLELLAGADKGYTALHSPKGEA